MQRLLIVPGLVLGLVLGLALAAAAGVGAWLGSPAEADGGNIQVTQIGAETKYPDLIRFFVTATSPDEIDEIRVFFRKTGKVTARAYRHVEVEPGYTVTGEAFLATGFGADYIPPGTEITYFFEVRDGAGAVLQTPEQKVVYNNPRFDRQSLSSGSITIYFYGEGAEDDARLAVDAAVQALARMAPILGFDPTEPVRIVSYHRISDLVKALPLRLQALQGKVQTEGVSFGDERVVLIAGYDPDVKGITSHEITHLAVAEVTGRASPRVPAWLGEGLAEYGNIEPGAGFDTALRNGIITQRVRPLWTLDSFTGSGDDIIRAYGQGRSVVKYLISTYGEAKLAELMQAIRNSFDIDQALEAVYGLDQYGLDTEWRIFMGMEPLPKPEVREFTLPRIPTPTRVPTPTPSPTQPPTLTPEPTATMLPPTPTPVPAATETLPTATPQPTPRQPAWRM